MKECTRCSISKPLEMFHKRLRSTDGFNSHCKECRKVIDAASYKASAARQQIIKERRVRIYNFNTRLMRRYKRFCGCVLCREREPVALDLHHVDATEKDANPSALCNHSTAALRKEIRKCVVLCSNCHRKVHAGILHLPV